MNRAAILIWKRKLLKLIKYLKICTLEDNFSVHGVLCFDKDNTAKCLGIDDFNGEAVCGLGTNSVIHDVQTRPLSDVTAHISHLIQLFTPYSFSCCVVPIHLYIVSPL